MATSRYDPNTGPTKPSDVGVTLANPTYSSQGSTQSSASSASGFSGINDPQALAILQATLAELAAGGSPEFLAQRATRRKQLADTQALQSEFTTAKAFSDADALMAQQLRLALEKNMPAISKAIEGAGTSASSMQGLLSQKLSTEAAQASGAMGAEQAKAYAQAQVGLQGVLEALTRTDNTQMENLLKALDLKRVQTQSSSSQSSGSSFGESGGGGSFFQPINMGGFTDSTGTGASAPRAAAPSGSGGTPSMTITPTNAFDIAWQMPQDNASQQKLLDLAFGTQNPVDLFGLY